MLVGADRRRREGPDPRAEGRSQEIRGAVGHVRRAYDDLGLRITAPRDGTLDIRWGGGESVLEPQVLRERSVSHRT